MESHKPLNSDGLKMILLKKKKDIEKTEFCVFSRTHTWPSPIVILMKLIAFNLSND